ncbi:MAG: pilus assembly protein TadG-related protein [Hyphomicrobiaceae bacterium]
MAIDRGGNVALIFAFSAIALFGLAGGAIDFARWLHAKNLVRAALDSAVLAGGRTLQINATNPDLALTTAQTYFDRMKPSDLTGNAATFALAENSTVVRGVVNGGVNTPLLGILGFSQLPVQVAAEAVVAAGGNSESSIEVSVMLDVTGSMAGQKIEDMKAAAKDLVDIVVWSDQSQYTSKVAIAPFARRVNVGSYIASVTGLPATNGSGKKLIRCVTEREGTEQFTDAAPGAGAYVKAYAANNNANDNSNYSNSGNCSDPSSSEMIVPLTNDKVALKSSIDALTDGGTTAGTLGTAWAWYLISPNWANVWPEASRPQPYSGLTTLGPSGRPALEKIVVLMTDGAYNTYDGGQSSLSSTTISDRAVSLCTGMKAAGIKVYTVGFDLGSDELAISTLKSCASREANDPVDQPSYFYNTSTGDELRQAFRDIALKIATLRLRA